LAGIQSCSTYCSQQTPVYNGVGVVKNFLKHTPSSASRELSVKGGPTVFVGPFIARPLTPADGSLQSRPDEAKLRPYSGFFYGV
jgi:hypothetical protein